MGKVSKSRKNLNNIEKLEDKVDDKIEYKSEDKVDDKIEYKSDKEDKEDIKDEHTLNDNDSQYQVHQMSLNENMFDLVKSGKKTIEGRINDNKRLSIKIGDFINFKKNKSEETVMVQVLKITRHGDFEKALRSGKLKNMLPGFRTVKEGVEYYYKFPNYEKKSIELGVVNFYITTNSLEYE